MTKWVIGVAVLLIVLVGVRLVMGLSGPSDEEKIQMALDEAIAAAQDGEPGPVLDFISRNAEFQGAPAVDRREVANYIKRFEPEIDVLNRDVSIEGDTARMTSPVSFRLAVATISIDETIPRVEIDFVRERDYEWLVFPSSKWRVIKVSAPGWSPPMP